MAVGLVVLGIGVACAILLLWFAFRRRLLMRGVGAIEMSVRLRSRWLFGGWALGVGMFNGEQLLWYRVFSFVYRPARRLSRDSVRVESKREPGDDEVGSVPPSAVILSCWTGDGVEEIAMSVETVTGFLSWLESAPPGYSLPGPGVAAR